MKESFPYLEVLSTVEPRLRKMMIDQAPSTVVDALCECCLNVLKGAIPLTTHQKRCLTRYETQLRALAKKRISQKQKKKVPNQKGAGLVSSLLPPALMVLQSLLS